MSDNSAERLTDSQKSAFLLASKQTSPLARLYFKAILLFSFTYPSYDIKISKYLEFITFLSTCTHWVLLVKNCILLMAEHDIIMAPLKRFASGTPAILTCLLVHRVNLHDSERFLLPGLVGSISMDHLIWRAYFRWARTDLNKIDTMKFLSGEMFHEQLDEDQDKDLFWAEQVMSNREREKYRLFRSKTPRIIAESSENSPNPTGQHPKGVPDKKAPCKRRKQRRHQQLCQSPERNNSLRHVTHSLS